eukprot:1158029-Pelagomonas_calceolata.AAC.4
MHAAFWQALTFLFFSLAFRQNAVRQRAPATGCTVKKASSSAQVCACACVCVRASITINKFAKPGIPNDICILGWEIGSLLSSSQMKTQADKGK